VQNPPARGGIATRVDLDRGRSDAGGVGGGGVPSAELVPDRVQVAQDSAGLRSPAINGCKAHEHHPTRELQSRLFPH